VTLAEFLAPVKGAGQKELVQAVLYFGKHHGGRDGMSAADIRDGLTKARVPWARSANIARALGLSVPNVDQAERGLWVITATGEERIRDLMGLPSAEPEVHTDVATLRRLEQKVPDETTRDYIEEAVKCLQVGARRAAVVFMWSGAVSAIRDEVWQHGARQIEAALQGHNPRARFRKKNDFEGVKDSDLLQVAQDLAVYDKSQKRRLGEALDLRNDCGHPVKYRPGEKKVSSFIEDVITVVFV
jgi:hypothetical protein